MKVLLASCVIAGICIAASISYKKDVLLTPDQKTAVEQFRNLVVPEIPKTSFVYKWAKDDVYLLKWLTATSMDVKKAAEKFQTHLKWRETEKIEEIDNEDWSVIKKEFPYFQDTVDKLGRPIGEVWFNEWNVYQAILDGKSTQLYRWLLRNLEVLNRRLYDARSSGKDIEGVLILEDFEDLSLLLQACPYCLPLYSNLWNIVENNYPALFDKILIVNTPSSVNVIMWACQPFMSEKSKESLKLMTNREDWLPVLNEIVDPSQRDVLFGGTLKRKYGNAN